MSEKGVLKITTLRQNESSPTELNRALMALNEHDILVVSGVSGEEKLKVQRVLGGFIYHGKKNSVFVPCPVR